ncbi:MAG: SpoIIE family protein phosphatase [Proteobacteria bacterium]|nr:SpoIIE family protein phosphatase [Pseudomonadota bacterium]
MTAPIANDPSDTLELEQLDDVRFLAAFSQFFAVSRDVGATLETALTGIIQGINAEAGALFLLDEATGELVCHATVGPLDLRGARVMPGHGILGRCLRRNEIEAIHEARNDPELLGAIDEKNRLMVRSALCAPLAADGRPFGAIQVVNKRPRGPFGQRDSYLLQTMANSAALAVANARMAEELVRQEVTQRELDLAAEIQRSLLPNAETNRLPVHGLNRPIRQVSGDFYDFFALPDGRIPFALGDVSGKGINAALLMAKAASLFRCLGKRSDDPATIMAIINREIHETSSRGMFVTMVAGTYDPSSGLVRFANAGHEPPLLRNTDRSYRTFPAEAPPLGILPEMEYWTQEVNLNGGEFYIFSDGLMEFHYHDNEELGVEGLIQLLEGLAELPLGERLGALLSELDNEGWEVRDDLTVLAIDDSGGRRLD